MKEVVDKIIKEEKEARARTEEARMEATKIIADAEEEARRLAEGARTKAKDETMKIIEKATSEAKDQKEEIIQEANRQAKTIKEGHAGDIKKAIQLVFQRVIG